MESVSSNEMAGSFDTVYSFQCSLHVCMHARTRTYVARARLHSLPTFLMRTY